MSNSHKYTKRLRLWGAEARLLDCGGGNRQFPPEKIRLFGREFIIDHGIETFYVALSEEDRNAVSMLVE